MVVDGVDKPDSHVRVVVCHQDDVEQLFALRVQIPQTCVYGLQRLSRHGNCQQLIAVKVCVQCDDSAVQTKLAHQP